MEVVVDANGDWAESRLRSAAAMQFLAVVNTTKSAQTNQDSLVNTSQCQKRKRENSFLIHFLAKKWGYREELGGVFGSNVPLALLIDLYFAGLMPTKTKTVADELSAKNHFPIVNANP